MSNINFCIVHYNTPELTECLIKSINKFTPDCQIYVFDNSDKFPFVYRQSNITYLDNTNGQIINFSEWIKKYPQHCGFCYSAKHCYTIQKCIEIIGKPFILLDSDVLLKCDVSELWDEELAFVGHLSDSKKRVYPFICFLNPQLLDRYGIKYFDDTRMLELNGRGENIAKDTGATLYLAKDKIPHGEIDYNDFIVHYGGGSYGERAFKMLHRGQISKDEWVEDNKNLWQ